MKDFDLENLKGRINPQYSNTIGTESYERRLCVDEIVSLRLQLAEANAKVIFCEDRMIRLEAKLADLTARLEASEELNKKLQSLVDANQKLMDVQGRRENRQARLEAQEASEPVATICMPDPDDERDGVRFNLKDWEKLNALPAGTKLYTTPQPTPTVQAAVAAALREFGMKVADAAAKAEAKGLLQINYKNIIDRVLGEVK